MGCLLFYGAYTMFKVTHEILTRQMKLWGNGLRYLLP